MRETKLTPIAERLALDRSLANKLMNIFVSHTDKIASERMN